jgi:hypothetical protein
LIFSPTTAAQELGLPLLPPSKAQNASFHRGANFAITGGTSLDTSFFQARGLGRHIWSSGSLHTQLRWFDDMKPAICNSPKGSAMHLVVWYIYMVCSIG